MTDSRGMAPESAAIDESADAEPTQAEIDAWAAAERARREEWLKGPSAEEREAYALRSGEHARDFTAIIARAERLDDGKLRIEFVSVNVE